MTALFTIGYEGLALDELVATLSSHEITRVIDVRELPLSRRRGFSKTPLRERLAVDGIEYVHLREAGNPFRRDKDVIERDELLGRYRVHLNASRPVVGVVAEAVREHRAALLCYEHDPRTCHRSILAPRVARKLGVPVLNL
ncbi:MAG: DUF488 domain-containing protein [Kofleriaceae bacterium]